MNKTTRKSPAAQKEGGVSAPSFLTVVLPKAQKFIVPCFFIALWALLAFYESALLKRTESFSLFLFDGTYFDTMMSVPAGMLSYIGCFLNQFLYYPVQGATVYVALLFVVYLLVRKVFEIPSACSLLALVPVVALVASNTQLGYWLFYLKMPGYYYMALVATLFSLLGIWAYKSAGNVLRMALLVVWVVAGYPLMGVYALVSALLMALLGIVLARRDKKRMTLPLVAMAVALLLVCVVPRLYYYYYVLVPLERIYVAGVPAMQWKQGAVDGVVYETESVWQCIHLYWAPFCLLLLSMLGGAVSLLMRGRFSRKSITVSVSLLFVLSLLFSYCFWFGNKNFRIENRQMVAMWNEDWESVAGYAKDSDEPTRQIILNKNIALINMGKVGSEMFAYPDGGVLPISPLAVHMTHTDGSSVYFNYGKFNYSYRWCVENSVEYGWRPEYLKNAARSMLLAGEYRLAARYINILKSTMFHGGWARELEKYIDNPELIVGEKSFAIPLQFACYEDVLGVDEGVEAHLTSTLDAQNVQNLNNTKMILSMRDAFVGGDIKALMAAYENKKDVTVEFIESSLLVTLIKKDSKRFWNLFGLYLEKHLEGVDMSAGKVTKYLPVHYQEALLLFMFLDKGKSVNIGDEFLSAVVSRTPGGAESRFGNFQRAVAVNRDALRKKYPDIPDARMNAQLAALLKKDFGNTYYYYYFFVKKIKTY